MLEPIILASAAMVTADFNRSELTDQLAGALQDSVLQTQLALSDAQMQRLIDYVELLSKWNHIYNLTAVREPQQMVIQHLLDSLAALPAFNAAQRVLDVGAGGGLPGIVLAIWAAQAWPEMRITLLDTVRKKTAFLTQVKAELRLTNVEIVNARIEQWRSVELFDVITARAFAELADLVSWSAHLLQAGGRFIALKGVLPQAEIAALPAGWRVTDIQRLRVPTLDAERHLIFVEKAN